MIKPYEPLYTVKEVAKILKTNSDVVYGLIKEQQLPGLKLGSMRIRGSDLERFIEKYPTEGGDNNAQTL
nr:helix-turn-helix domain-containing protein [[Clostridium] symbiosum]